MIFEYLTDEEVNGSWTPMSPKEVVELFKNCKFSWWIAGGYAIEQFVGNQYRSHEDIDLIVLRSDLNELKNYLIDWELCPSDPPGKLRMWKEGEVLPSHVHDIWVRKNSKSPWAFQIMVNDSDGDDFLYKRDHKIRFPIRGMTVETEEGVKYLAPELQLLHKAKSFRDKDQLDFEKSLPLLKERNATWLKDKIKVCYSESHPWIERLDQKFKS